MTDWEPTRGDRWRIVISLHVLKEGKKEIRRGRAPFHSTLARRRMTERETGRERGGGE